MKRRLILLLSVLALRVSAADLALTLIAPSDPVSPGKEVAIDLVALNPGATAAPFEVGFVFWGRLLTERGSWPVELHAPHVTPSAVPAGGFLTRRYTFTVPAEAFGRAVLEAEQTGVAPLRTAFLIDPGSLVASRSPISPVSRLAAPGKVIDAVINRTFAGRLTPNDPIYFIYGGGDASAKFQFSFNYRLGTVEWGPRERRRTSHLQLGYTQRSLWDIDARSSPFYDTSYMPEVSVDTLASVGDKRGDGLFTWIGLRTGVQHESNGRAGDGSRSLNIAYVRPMFAVGPLDSWHLVAFPEVFGYVTSIDENENLKDYRGYGKLRAVFGKTNGPSLLLAAWCGQDFNHATYQLDFAYPIRTRLLNIESFLLVQYFNGYGESLLAYDRKSNALRFGVALLR